MAVKSKGHFEIRGNYGTFSCSAFPVSIKFPLLQPTLAMVDGHPMTEIAFEFGPVVPEAVRPGMAYTTVRNMGHFVLHAISTIYVDFYEKHRTWIQTQYSRDAENWPPLFNFARMMRNFISHHAGHVGFTSPKSPSVAWHHLSYSPADTGKLVLGTDVNIGDLLMLFFEIGDELDYLGCPLNP